MRHLAQLPVLVLGLGESGLAMARWCAHNGAHVRAWDSREAPPHAATLATELPQVQLLAGALDPGPLLGEGGVRLILKSPGLAPHHPAIAPLRASPGRRSATSWRSKAARRNRTADTAATSFGRS